MRDSKKIVAVLVARQGSSRLPGKALAQLIDKSVVGHIIERLQLMKYFDDICLATSNLPIDAPLIEEAKKYGAKSYAGAPEDVLDRFTHAAESCQADVVVEVGGDCPLIDAGIVGQALDLFFEKKAGYVTNVEPQTFPDGLDIHVIGLDSLKLANKKALLASHRRHPLAYFHAHKELLSVINFSHSENLSSLRWTLDYPEDFQFLKIVYESLYPNKPLFGMSDILQLIEEKPELVKINSKWVSQPMSGSAPAYWFNSTYAKDLLEDLGSLKERCLVYETSKNYSELREFYRELENVAVELKERANYLAENN